MPRKKPEYIEGREALENFERALDKVVKAPHSEIKAKLDAEKKAKEQGVRRASDKPTKEGNNG
jgi:hypothetical protein